METLSKRAGVAWWALVVGAMVSLAGCGTFYVDGGTKDVDPSRYRKAEPAHAAQVLFEFQTKGVSNARVTELLKARVIEQVKASGIFSAVSEAPVAGGALLSITVNNVPTDDQAFSKGFVTGLTFGLVGSQVSDGYVCTAKYSGAEGSPPVVKLARHLIHTTIGATGPPPNAIKAPSLMEAVTIMMRQIVGTVLLDVSTDPTFK